MASLPPAMDKMLAPALPTWRLTRFPTAPAALPMLPGVEPVKFLDHQNRRWACGPAGQQTLLMSAGSEERSPSSEDAEDQNEPQQSQLPDRDTLERTAEKLSYEQANIFVRKPNYSLYRDDVVLEDRINGETSTGTAPYMYRLHKLKIFGHLRFVFVRMRLVSMKTELEEGVVVFRWQILGLKALRMFALFIPRKLWFAKNMNEAAEVWREGVSTYYVDGRGQVYKHVVDNKRESKERQTSVDKIKEKLDKLKKRAVPAPA